MKNNPNKKATLANIPVPVLQWLKARADYVGGTISSEITKLARAAMEAEAKDRATATAPE
jgi:hypothetical protein